jgi:hypothetical protein
LTLDISGASVELGGVDLLDYLLQNDWSLKPVASAPLGWMCRPPGVEEDLITLPLAVIRQVESDLLAIFDAASDTAAPGGKTMIQRISVGFDLTAAAEFVEFDAAVLALAREYGLDSDGQSAHRGRHDIGLIGTAEQVTVFWPVVLAQPILAGLNPVVQLLWEGEQRPSHRITVTFTLTDAFVEVSEAVRTLAATFGLESTGSGAGFGQRDIDFEGTPGQVEAFDQAVRAMPELAGLDVDTSIDDGSEEEDEGALPGDDLSD